MNEVDGDYGNILNKIIHNAQLAHYNFILGLYISLLMMMKTSVLIN